MTMRSYSLVSFVWGLATTLRSLPSDGVDRDDCISKKRKRVSESSSEDEKEKDGEQGHQGSNDDIEAAVHQVNDDDDDKTSSLGSAESPDQEINGRNNFLMACLRIARNDATLLKTNWWSRFYVGIRQNWNDSDLFVLGRALAGNTHLQVLQLENTHLYVRELEEGRGVQELCKGIGQTQCKKIMAYRMADQLQQSLFQELEQMSTLTSLTICNTTLNLPNLTIRPNRFLEKLKLIGCQLNDNGDLMTLANWVSSNPNLSYLELSRNSITDDGIMSFCRHWKDDSPLQALILKENDIGSNGAVQLLQATTRHAAFRQLDLSWNHEIGRRGLALMGQELPQIEFTDLILSHCAPLLTTPVHSTEQATHDSACRSLADGLRRNASLVTFHVGSNSLGAKGAQLLMQAVSVHPSLKSLSFEYDEYIGLSGIKSIGMALPHTKLEELALHGVLPHGWPNPQTTASLAAANALLEGVRHNGTLTRFDFVELPDAWNDPIQFHVEWNESYRPLLCSEVLVPAAWPYILERLPCVDKYSYMRSDLLSRVYLSLREQPWLVVASSSMTKTPNHAVDKQHANMTMEALVRWTRQLLPNLSVART